MERYKKLQVAGGLYGTLYNVASAGWTTEYGTLYKVVSGGRATSNPISHCRCKVDYMESYIMLLVPSGLHGTLYHVAGGGWTTEYGTLYI